MAGSRELRELHDRYVAVVNSAIGAGRLDLVAQLADEYVDEAVELITHGGPATCGASSCAVCDRPRRAVEVKPRRQRWLHRAPRSAAS